MACKLRLRMGHFQWERNEVKHANKLALLAIALSLPVYAGDIDGKAVLGGAIGGGAGAGIGSAVGGREGAIIGGGIGGAAGTRPRPQIVERKVVHVEHHHHKGRHLGHHKHKHKHKHHDHD